MGSIRDGTASRRFEIGRNGTTVFERPDGSIMLGSAAALAFGNLSPITLQLA
jgi:hypothetical protein